MAKTEKSFPNDRVKANTIKIGMHITQFRCLMLSKNTDSKKIVLMISIKTHVINIGIHSFPN